MRRGARRMHRAGRAMTPHRPTHAPDGGGMCPRGAYDNSPVFQRRRNPLHITALRLPVSGGLRAPIPVRPGGAGLCAVAADPDPRRGRPVPRRGACAPEGHLKIAQRFIAG
jgi:hypothetical protein